MATSSEVNKFSRPLVQPGMHNEERKRLAQDGLHYLAGALACYWGGDEAGTDRWLRRVEEVVGDLENERVDRGLAVPYDGDANLAPINEEKS